MPNSAYWDACVFIAALEKLNKDRVDACLDLVRQAKSGELVIVTSAWAIIEVNKLDDLEKATGVLREDQSKMILDFFENPYIKVRQLDRATAELAHELTRTHGLTNADAVHVATAILAKVDVFYTYDDAKKKRKGLLRHDGKIGKPPLSIKRPPSPTHGPLFDKKPDDEPPATPPIKANGSTQS